MKLSKVQSELCTKYGVNPDVGLSTDDVMKQREDNRCFNVVDPPIKCPAWVCCLLPCIKHIPSMVAFQKVKPEDAEILRNGKWIRYDCTSLVTGDIIQLEEGDIVPADCIVLSVDDDDDDDNDNNNDDNFDDEPTTTTTTRSSKNKKKNRILVDSKYITGELKPRSTSPQNFLDNVGGEEEEDDEETAMPLQLYYGSQIVQGSGIAIVTAIGPNTLLASLIRDKKFPVPIGGGSGSGSGVQLVERITLDGTAVDEESGISLVQRGDAM